jgi:hypothetical protein
VLIDTYDISHASIIFYDHSSASGMQWVRDSLIREVKEKPLRATNTNAFGARPDCALPLDLAIPDLVSRNRRARPFYSRIAGFSGAFPLVRIFTLKEVGIF